MVYKKMPMICSFCGKNEHEAVHMVAGPTVFICDECVRLCQDIIDLKMAHSGLTLEQEREKLADLRKSRESR